LYTSPVAGSVCACAQLRGPLRDGWRVFWEARPIGSRVAGSRDLKVAESVAAHRLLMVPLWPGDGRPGMFGCMVTATLRSCGSLGGEKKDIICFRLSVPTLLHCFLERRCIPFRIYRYRDQLAAQN